MAWLSRWSRAGSASESAAPTDACPVVFVEERAEPCLGLVVCELGVATDEVSPSVDTELCFATSGVRERRKIISTDSTNKVSTTQTSAHSQACKVRGINKSTNVKVDSK